MSEQLPGDVRDFLGNQRVRFWMCIRRDHRRTAQVEWRDGVAHCLHPGCGITSDDTEPMMQRIQKAHAERDALATQLDQYRAWLAAEIEMTEGETYGPSVAEALAEARGYRKALKRFDEITGKGE